MDNVNVLIKHEILAHSQGWLLIMGYGVIGSTRDFGSLSEDSDSSGPAKNSKMRCSIMVITSDSGPDNLGPIPSASAKRKSARVA